MENYQRTCLFYFVSFVICACTRCQRLFVFYFNRLISSPAQFVSVACSFSAGSFAFSFSFLFVRQSAAILWAAG